MGGSNVLSLVDQKAWSLVFSQVSQHFDRGLETYCVAGVMAFSELFIFIFIYFFLWFFFVASFSSYAFRMIAKSSVV